MSPIAFIIREQGRRTDVMLGKYVVAVVDKYSGDTVCYRFCLPGCGGARRVTGYQRALQLVMQVLADWMVGAGPQFAGIAEEILDQARLERSAA
jgi:hypothetical protein